MWTRSAASKRASLRALYQRPVFPIRELGQSSRRSWRGYRSYASSTSWATSGRQENALGCLRYQRHDNDDDKRKVQIERNVPNTQNLRAIESLVRPLRSQQQQPVQSEFQLQPPHRERYTLAFCLTLNEARTFLESYSRINMTKRSFSTSGDSSKKDESANQRTEPDFAAYLTGTTDKEGKTGSPKPVTLDVTPPPPAEAHIDLEGKQPPLDDHSEAYRYIRRRQRTNWERAREKTTENVQRALAGNVVICAAKLAASISSGSSSMFSEFIHSVVDCGNQSLLLLGLRDAGNVADRRHPYGYGKSIYFWALVSALGTFFLGAGISGTQAWAELMEPSLNDISWEVWSVLGFSFAVDGYVLTKTIVGIRESMPKDIETPFWSYVAKIRDPATMAVSCWFNFL